MKKAIVLLSGGIDSATTLYIAKSRGYRCTCLIFDYGQKNNKEVKAAERIAKKAGCNFRVLNFKLPWGGSSLLERRLKIPQHKKFSTRGIPTTYVPARNTIFLSFALSFAETEGASSIFIGAHTQDFPGYPDCRPIYFHTFRKVASFGTKRGIIGKRIKILTPLLHKSKSDIIKIGLKLGVPYELTWSCYKGGAKPCGKCDSCLFRTKGFIEIGMRDPIYDKR